MDISFVRARTAVTVSAIAVVFTEIVRDNYDIVADVRATRTAAIFISTAAATNNRDNI